MSRPAWLPVLLLVAVLGGCGQGAPSHATPVASSAAPTSTPTPTATATETPTPTPTPKPAPAPPPTRRPSATAAVLGKLPGELKVVGPAGTVCTTTATLTYTGPKPSKIVIQSFPPFHQAGDPSGVWRFNWKAPSTSGTWRFDATCTVNGEPVTATGTFSSP